MSLKGKKMWKRSERLQHQMHGRLNPYLLELNSLKQQFTTSSAHFLNKAITLAHDLQETSMSNFCDWREVS